MQSNTHSHQLNKTNTPPANFVVQSGKITVQRMWRKKTSVCMTQQNPFKICFYPSSTIIF